MSTTWMRMIGIAALVSVIMLFASIATWANPQFNGPLNDITGYFIHQSVRAQISVDLNLLGAIPSLLFGVGLLVLLRTQGEDILGYFSLAGAVLVGAVSLMFMASNEALIAFAGSAPHGEIRLLMALDNAIDNMLFFAMALWVGSASLGTVRSGLFAAWIGWLGLIAALCMILADMVYMTTGLPTGMLGVLLYVIWSIAIGVSLLLRSVRTPASSASALPAIG